MSNRQRVFLWLIAAYGVAIFVGYVLPVEWGIPFAAVIGVLGGWTSPLAVDYSSDA